MKRKSVLLIITGSIAAYKSLDVIRRLRERNIDVRCVLTKGGAEFITPLSVASLSGNPVYGDLFSLKDETEMGHIRLSREADLILVAPASADFIAKMVSGKADDLASAAVLAADKTVLLAPAMNSKMWENPATQRNLAQLRKDGVRIIAPAEGDLACGEVGSGRLADTDAIVAEVVDTLKPDDSLVGLKVLITSGPTHEPIDPVRYIGNHSSGKQGHAIAEALLARGAQVRLVSGPVTSTAPEGAEVTHVETALQMLDATLEALPADVVICAAAVADWRPKQTQTRKIKKRANDSAPTLALETNPDILRTVATLKKQRPRLVIGFAAETEDLKKNAEAKLKRKGCDWLIANEVAGGKVFGKDETSALFLDGKKTEKWDDVSKKQLAERLADKIAALFPRHPGAGRDLTTPAKPDKIHTLKK